MEPLLEVLLNRQEEGRRGWWCGEGEREGEGRWVGVKRIQIQLQQYMYIHRRMR